MFLDAIHGIISRRILLNYRVVPDVLARALPTPFRPKLYRGWGVGGICMIRFQNLRPRFLPSVLGVSSENAAHRIAVEWTQDGEVKEGVFIPRRDTNSWFNYALGGRVFPGILSRSKFDVAETDQSVSVKIIREDGKEEAAFAGSIAAQLPGTSIFPNLEEATGFFSLGATGYSATREEGHYHGMELKTLNWTIAPLKIDRAYSRFFSNLEMFPQDSVHLDNALLMRNILHEWHSRPDLKLSSDSGQLTSILQ
jgi:hypothetical protein